MINSLEAQILTPDGPLFDDEVTGVRMPGTEGSFEVKPRHASIISTLKPGKIIVRKMDGQDLEFAVGGGLVEVHNNMLTLLAEAAESIEEIDIERAREAKERAEERLENISEDKTINRNRAEKARARAENRIKLASGTGAKASQD